MKRDVYHFTGGKQMLPIIPILAGIAAGVGLTEATKRTYRWFKKTPVERAQCSLEEQEESLAKAKKHLASTEAAEVKAAKTTKAKAKA